PAEYPVRNVSLSRPALVATLVANRVATSRDERNRFSAALRRVPGFHLRAGRIFGSEAVFEADRFFAKDRDLLRHRFGVELNPPDLSGDCRAFGVDEKEFGNIRGGAGKLGCFRKKDHGASWPFVQARQPA